MEKMTIVAPSLLAADFMHLKKELQIIKDRGVKWLHFDVMDGHFVPNISFGSELLKAIKKEFDFFYDVHIMVSNPVHAAKKLIDSGADLITFHYEACDDVLKVIDEIKEYNQHIKIGLSIKPMTDVKKVLSYINKVDLILIMSVEPGAGGQKFNASSLEKISTLRKTIDKEGYSTLIEVDGGINDETGRLVIEAGVDVLVAGTYIFKNEDIKKAIDSLIVEK